MRSVVVCFWHRATEALRSRPDGSGAFVRYATSSINLNLATAKAYADPYLAPGKPVWLVGLSFARDTRHFVEGTVLQVK